MMIKFIIIKICFLENCKIILISGIYISFFIFFGHFRHFLLD